MTNFDGRTQLAKDVRKNLRRDWPDEYLGEISQTIRVGEAIAKQIPVSVHAPSSTAADDYKRTAVPRAAARRSGSGGFRSLLPGSRSAAR